MSRNPEEIIEEPYRKELAILIDNSSFKSRRQFCKVAEIDEAHLSRFLQGKKEMSFSRLNKILAILGYKMVFVKSSN